MLPLKQEVDQLGNSLAMAISRFVNVERRLMRDEQLRLEYGKCMAEFADLGHMEEVVEEEVPRSRIFYLLHHPVIKTSSLTTKVRVVFDASAKSSSGLSLNDVLMCGPSIQEDLFSIVCRFRSHQFVITADVEKMFRQVEVAQEDRDLQRVVWRNHPSEPLRTYRLTRVAYGTTPASFMATKCLMVLAEGAKSQYPAAAAAIKGDFYMDDLMTEIAKGDVVIIKDDNLGPGRWNMARVIELHPGSDGHVRVVTVRLANGNEMKRPVVKLCRLPVDEDAE